ncbi:MAG: hypothetical protein HC838_17800 [Spirulinaceae cyanobacterium RM2_2_10]|nr:hypothetical protein [Spirulinaceae cyanobacterium RM2_2_10]
MTPPERDWSTQMLAEIGRLMALVQDYLDVTQLQDNPLSVLDREILQLDDLVHEAWQRLAPIAQPRRLKLDYAGHGSCQIYGDRRRLGQVLINLLDNAIKHSPTDSTIQVKIDCVPPTEGDAPTQLIIDTIDMGAGFAAADVEHVFERLYRSDSSRQRDTDLPATERSRRGSGLGLAIAREIVHAHGGTIIACNHPETGGAWLQIRLPCFY